MRLDREAHAGRPAVLAQLVLATVIAPGRAASAGILHDATTTAMCNSCSSLTFNHTVAGVKRMLIVASHVEVGSTLDVQSVTYGGQALTFAAGDTPKAADRVELWYLIAPPTGTNSVVVTYTQSLGYVLAAATSLAGVAQQAPEVTVATDTAGAAATSLAATLNGVSANAWIVDAFLQSIAGATIAANAGQIERYNLVQPGGLLAGGSTRPVATAGNETVGWTTNTSNQLGMVAVAVKAARRVIIVGMAPPAPPR